MSDADPILDDDDLNEDPPDGCGYQGYEFGAAYPDSLCIEGYLWDADSGDSDGSLSNGGEMACPGCNTAARIDQIRIAIQEETEPVTDQIRLWEYNLPRIISANQPAALKALREIHRHEFLRIGPDLHEIEVLESRIWPWKIEALSAHINLELAHAQSNPLGDMVERD